MLLTPERKHLPPTELGPGHPLTLKALTNLGVVYAAAGQLDMAVSLHEQALECGHSLATEIKILMLHGLLHLAGYDHETDNGEMRTIERRLRRRFQC